MRIENVSNRLGATLFVLGIWCAASPAIQCSGSGNVGSGAQDPEPGPFYDTDNDTISNAVEVDENNTALYPELDPDVPNLDFHTIAQGIPNSGTIFQSLNLPDTGIIGGYFHDPVQDAKDADDWGTLALINLIEAVGRNWADSILVNLRARPRVQILDLSLHDGGFFGGNPPHMTHQNGLDVDVRYLMHSTAEGALDICTNGAAYDTAATLDLLRLFLDLGNVDMIFVAPLSCLAIVDLDQTGILIYDASGVHDGHFHVKIDDPDGPFN